MGKFKILALDLHNTIYDEVLEFGLAIDAAISALPADRNKLYAELSAAHAEAGSDWDEDIWLSLPSLKSLDKKIIESALEKRRRKSEELTKSGVYEDAVEALKQVKAKGVRIYLITEAAADAGMQAINWLGLGGVVDGVYTFPSRKPAMHIPSTYHKPFAQVGAGHLKKPNPLLLAQLVLDHAKIAGNIVDEVKLNDVFETQKVSEFALPEYSPLLPMQEDIMAKLLVKDGKYKDVLQGYLNEMIFVGDSKFKDGIMARNAGVKFAYAAYGKKIKPGQEADFERSKEILYAVTGWDKETLKLTQEAGKSSAINSLEPDFALEKSLLEVVNQF